MAELDPLTNLPKEQTDPVEQARKTREKQTPAKGDGKPVQGTFDARDALRLKQQTPDMAIRPVSGAFGDYGDVSVTSDRNFNEIRAQSQTFTELAGKTLAQTAGTVVGMGIESVGFLGDIPMTVSSMVSDSEMDFERNIISKAGNYLEEKTREMFPIYQTKDAKSGDMSRFMDATYWASHLPSIASTVSLMVPAGALARGAAFAARAAKLGKVGQRTAATVAATFGSRHMEGMLEGFESYETDYQRAIDNGLTEADAHKFASESAANTYKLGYSNVLMDALQWGSLLRGVNFANRGITQSIKELGEQAGSQLMKIVSRILKRNPELTLKNAVKKAGFSWRNYLAQAGMEGYEEFNQEFIKRLSSHNADIAMGLTDGTQMGFGEAMFSGLMGEHFTDAGTWDAALMGFLGGAVFQGVGELGTRAWNRNTEENRARRIKSEQEKLHYIKDTLNNIKMAVAKGDNLSAQKERESLIFNLAIGGMQTKNAEFDGSAIEGTLGNTKEMFEAIQNMTPEDLEAMGLTEESKQEAEWALKELNKIEGKLNKFYNEINTGTNYDGAIATMLTEHSYKLEKGRERLAEIESLIEQEQLENPVLNDALTPLSSTQKRLVNLKNELEAKKTIYRQLKAAETDPNPFGQAPFRLESTKKIRKQTLKQLETEMNELAQDISNSVPKNQRNKMLAFGEEFSPTIEDIAQPSDIDTGKQEVDQVLNISSQLMGQDSKINEYYMHKEMQRIENAETAQHQQNLLDPKKQSEVIESMKDRGKTLRTKAVSRAMRARHGSGDYLNQDGRIFKIKYDDQTDGVELMEVDRDLNPVEGAEFKRVTDPDRLENIFRAQPIDRTLTEEELSDFREKFDNLVSDGNFGKAFGIISEVLYKSNYGDRSIKTVKEFMDKFEEYIGNIDSFNELARVYNEIQDILPAQELEQELLAKHDFDFQAGLWTRVATRADEISERFTIEIESLNKALDIKQKRLEDAEQRLEELPNELEEFKLDKEIQIEQIFNELAEQENKGLIENLDRRTKPARKIEALEQEIADKTQEIKDERKANQEQKKQTEKDIKILKDLKSKLESGDMPSVLLNNEIQEMQGVIDGIRAKLLLRANMTEEQAETMQERYDELDQELEKAITAIEKFHAYVKTLDDSGKLLKRASHKAYNTLLERGILSGNETIFVGVGEQVFAEYRRLFNQNITEILRDEPYLEAYTPALRRIMNENRLTGDIQGANVNYWATFAIDYPLQSELFTDEQVTNIKQAKVALGNYRNAVRNIDSYRNILNFLNTEYAKRKMEVKPENLSQQTEETEDEVKIKRWEAPQRTIFSAFTRPAGNSGTNLSPNSDASQRRYFRYINKTDFEAEQHNFKIVKPTGEFEIALDLPEGYEAADVLLSVIVDDNGNYIDESGDRFEEFDPERALYTTMPLPTYETLSSEYGRTFDPSDDYLKKNFSGKTAEERKKNYEAVKAQKLEEYKALRESWLEDIENDGEAIQPIIGKSLGVPYQQDNHHMYSEGATPSPLTEVFDNPKKLEMWVNTTGYEEHYGETVYMPKGHVVIRNPKTGNLSEAPVRQLNDTERLTIINALKTYVRQSTLENGRFNQTEEQEMAASMLRDAEGNPLNKNALQLIQDYIYSFDKRRGKAPVEFIKSKKAKNTPGGILKIGNQTYELLANDPDTGEKVKQINPAVVDALKTYLDGRLFHVRSNLLTGENANKGFSKIEYADGEFKSRDFDTYKDFIIEDEVVGTWLQNASKTQMTVEDGGTIEAEQAYQFYNQQPIFALPETGTTPESTAEDQGSKLNSIDDLPFNEDVYITPIKPSENDVYAVTKTSEGITIGYPEGVEGGLTQEEEVEVAHMIQRGEMQFTKSPNVKKPKVSDPTPKKEDVPKIDASEKEMMKNMADRLKGLNPKEIEGDLEQDDDVPFQRAVTGGKKLTQKGFNQLASHLQKATGIPVVHLSTKQALGFLKDLKERNYHDNDFNENTVPYGMYHEGVAYVFGESISAETAFHEVAHAVVYQIMDQNPELMESLLESLAETKEGQAIIEHVADNYVNAVENNEVTVQGAAEMVTTAIGRYSEKKYLQKNEEYKNIIQRIFEAIREFFNEYFGTDIQVNELSTETTIEDIADMLVDGKKIQVTPNLVDINFSKRPSMLTTSEMVLPGQTVKFTQDALNMLDYQFFNQLFHQYPEKLASLFTPESNRGVYGDIMNRIYNGLLKKALRAYEYLENDGQGTPKFNRKDISQEIDNVVYLLENWDKVTELHRRNLGKYNIELISEETLENETEKNTNRLWQEESIKFSAKQNATSSIRMLVGSLKSRDFNDTFPTFRKNADFGKAFNLLANHMANTTTLEQKQKILEDLQGEDGMQDLMNRLFSKDIDQMTKEDISTAMYLLEFNRTFSKHFEDYKLIFNDESNVFKAVDATVNSGKRRLLQNWESSVLLRQDLYEIEDGRKVYKQDYFKNKYPDKYDNDGKLVKKFIITRDLKLNDEYQQKLEDVAPKDRARYTSYYKTLQFLEDLGVNITADVAADNKFNKAAQQTLQMIKSGDTTDIFSADSNVAGNLDMFAQHQIDYAKDYVENQHQNIDGETVYNVVLNHYVSLVQDKINNAGSLTELKEDMPHLFDSPYTEHSILLNRKHRKDKLYTRLFDEKGNRKETQENLSDQRNFRIDIAEGMKNKDQSVPFNQLSYGDKVQMAINSALTGRYSLFRAGDKKLERYMDMGDFFTSNEIKNGAHRDLFLEYLVDELKFIEDVLLSDENYKGLESLDMEFKDSVLPRLLSENSTLKRKMQDAIDSGEIGALLTDTEFVSTAGATLESYFDQKVEDARDYLEDFFLIEKKGDIYKNNGLLGLTDNQGVEYTEADVNAILKKVIVNRSVANIEQTKLFTGHPAFYRGSDNFFHRMSGAFGTKNISSVGHLSNKVIEKFFPQKRLYKIWDNQENQWITTSEYQEGAKPIMKSAVFADPKMISRYTDVIEDAITDKEDRAVYEKMEESDAMGLVSLETYRDMKLRAGEWTQALERLYQWEKRPTGTKEITMRNWVTNKEETITEKDLVNPDGSRTTFNMIKPQYFGPLAEQGFIPGMYKLAVLPVLPSYTNEAMSSLRNYMQESGTGLVTFESANKVGTKSPGEALYDSEGRPDFSNVTTQDTFFEYWGIQLATGNKIKDNVTLGSQFMKQILSGIYNKGEAFNEELGQLVGDMWATHNALIENGKQELIEELGLKVDNDGNYTVESVDSLINFLQEEANNRDANNNVIDGLSYLKSYIDGNLGLDVLPNRDKIENILASIAKSRVISQKVHGGAKVQAASTFFEQNPRVRVGDKILSQKDLKFYEDGTMEVLMPHYFKEIFGDRDVNDISADLLRAVGFRIPTSGMNVIENITIKGFLPQSAGEIVVLPTEIVAKAGSDFDVDKLNILLPNYKIVDGQPQYIEYFESALEARTFIEALAQELKDKTGRVPKKELIKKELIKRGYDNLAKTLGTGKKNLTLLDMNTKEGLQNRLIDIADQIMRNEGVQKNKFTPIGINILEKQKKRIDDLRGEPTEEVGYHDMLFDLVYGSRITQRNVESIAGTSLAALHVSDHVHATRYNYRMNEKHDIALPHNESDGLVSLGGKYSTDEKHEIGNLLNQITNMFIDGVKNPISFSLNLNLETAGVAMYLVRAGVPIEQVLGLLNQPIIRDYISYKTVNKSFANRDGNIMTSAGITDRLEAKYSPVGTEGKLNAVNLNRYMNPDQKGKEFKRFQKEVLDEYKKYEQSAQVLSEYVNSTRIDSVVMGQNTSQLDLILSPLERIENNNSGILGASDLLKDDTNGFLSPHYKALKDFRKMFKPFFYHLNNSSAMNMYEDVIQFVEGKQISMEDKVSILDKFKLDLITYQVLNSPVDINGSLVQPIGQRMDLMVGDNSLPKRILEIKQEGTDNLLLDYLLPIIGKEEINGQLVDNLKLMDQRLDVFEQNALIEAWRDLFFEQPQLASDLVQFTFLQNGLQLSPMTFTKFIPSEIYMKAINSAFENGMDINEDYFLEKFIENNYNDPNIVPTKWGKKVPSGDIFKVFSLKEGINQNEVSDYFNKGIFPYKPVPTIVVKGKGMKFGDRVLFKDGQNFRPKSFKDYRNNRALLSYGINPPEEVAPDTGELTEEQKTALQNRKDVSVKQENDNIKKCS